MTGKISFALLFVVFSVAIASAQHTRNQLAKPYWGAEIGVSSGYRNFIQMGFWLQFERDYYRIRITNATDNQLEIRWQTDEQVNSSKFTEAKGVRRSGIHLWQEHIVLKKSPRTIWEWNFFHCKK